MERPSGTPWRYDARETATRPELAPVFIEAPEAAELVEQAEDLLDSQAVAAALEALKNGTEEARPFVRRT